MKKPRNRSATPRIRPVDASTPTSAAEHAPAPPEVAVAQPSVASADVIRARAYELYVARGRSPGNELEDWLTAERAVHAGDGPGPAEASPAS